MHVSLCYIAVLKPSWNFFNQINTAENSNISFWCLQNCTIVSELKIQFLARATLLQWKRSYLKFRLCSSQSLSMKQELVEYWWATLKSWGGNPRQHFCYQERYWYYFFADRTHTHHLSPFPQNKYWKCILLSIHLLLTWWLTMFSSLSKSVCRHWLALPSLTLQHWLWSWRYCLQAPAFPPLSWDVYLINQLSDNILRPT